ncbi:MAG: hypothetical protein ACRC3I_08305 [Cetobacterium sp.]
MEKQEYKLFFENLDLIKRKYDILHSFEDEFNIFSILRNERDEDKLKKLVESIVVSIKKDLDKLKENEVI